MFERFSSGYYLGRLYVEPDGAGRAAISRAQHEQVNEQLYTGEGVERTDLPLVMKLGNTHFTVGGGDDVPADTLVVPESLVEETDIRNPPALREVFLAKADRARQLLSVAEGLPTVGSDSEAGVAGGDGGHSGDGTYGADGTDGAGSDGTGTDGDGFRFGRGDGPTGI
jgi:hypothetical protein